MMVKKILASLICLLVVFGALAGCAQSTGGDASQSGSSSQTAKAEQNGDSESDAKNNTDETTGKEDNMQHPQVLVKMENSGEFTIELYPEYAPETVENFLKLVNEGFYDGLTFHRVYAGFMAQGGDPDGNGMGGSKDKIKGEFSANGFSQNTLSHTRGVVSMARSQENNSASSQFFICYSDACAQLDGSYAAFGKVIDGMDVVDDFCNNEMSYNSRGEKASPVEPIYIKSMTQVK